MNLLSSDTDGVTGILSAVDSIWGLLALIVLGIYFLVYKFASQIIELLKENTRKTDDIQTSIITNHGSKNLGDAVDRLTTRVMFMQDNQGADRAMLRSLSRDLERHITECREYHRPGNFIVKEETSEPRQ